MSGRDACKSATCERLLETCRRVERIGPKGYFASETYRAFWDCLAARLDDCPQTHEADVLVDGSARFGKTRARGIPLGPCDVIRHDSLQGNALRSKDKHVPACVLNCGKGMDHVTRLAK